MKKRPWHALQRKAKRGYRGHPLATIALYGPDDSLATKLVAAIVSHDGADPEPMRKWHALTDIRGEAAVLSELREFLAEHGVVSVIIPEKLLGCPHEEGIDYPRGETCPRCPFWKSVDRWTGKKAR